MKLMSSFELDEEVWDTLTNKKVKVIGFSLNRGKNCCQSENNQDVYFVDNHMCGTFRKPEELMRLENEKVNNTINDCCGGNCECNAC